MQAMQGDWLPARAGPARHGPLFLAARDPASELQDPFMQETIARIPARESVVQIAREDLGRGTTGTSPAGIVFHVARCGSTLRLAAPQAARGFVVYARTAAVQRDTAAAATGGRDRISSLRCARSAPHLRVMRASPTC
jgi:hypothetical protein